MISKDIFKLKYIILYLFLFILLYYEHSSIGGIKISQIWKAPIYIYIFIYIVKKYNSKFLGVPLYLFYSLLLFVFVLYAPLNPFDSIFNLRSAFTVLSLPLSIAYFQIVNREGSNNVELFVVSMSSFLILYNLPFILKLIPEAQGAGSLEKFGLDTNALSGVFYHVNISSKVYVVASLVIIFNRVYFSNSIFKRLIYWPLVCLSIYSVYAAFTRTGWLLFIFGLTFVLFYKEGFKRLSLIAIPTVILFAFFTYIFIVNNSSVLMRLRGETTYRTNVANNSNQISSGRFTIWEYAINNIMDDGIISIFFGQGEKRALQTMKESFGYDNIPAHNYFIEIAQYGGIIGLLIYLKILQLVYFEVKKVNIVKGVYKSKLPLAIFIILILSCIPSHGLPLWSEIIFGGLIVCHRQGISSYNKL